ncbi:PREDICTED: uncharacterized protein LOC107189046 [Dufourea novaeangliae]|uniref:uncharacterized protein LOC107189046 n=1 Tax=Dufourea novaeangliae TaxID=178035 RepID=UPI00076780F8|nr:PREDICTED: uncharacterized protein LOC107189046 [Dufourea novaeangliae]
MTSFVMLNLHGLTVFIWIVSILTLSISDEVQIDGTTPPTHTSNRSLINTPSENNHPDLFTVIKPTLESINAAQIFKRNNVTPSFVGEGGPISFSSTTQRTSSTTLHLASISGNLNMKDTSAEDKEHALRVTKRNNTLSKIVPRKGATEVLNTEQKKTFIEKSLEDNKQSIVESSTTASVTNSEYTNDKLSNSELHISDEEKVVLNTTLNNKLHQNMNITLQQNMNTTLQQNITANTTMTTALHKEHKAKPTVTVAGPNNDKRPFVSPTRSRLGMPKKIDYVLPVIVTLIALPVLCAVIFIVYKQCRDCWDKRHYRRMDFLIDGMYND